MTIDIVSLPALLSPVHLLGRSVVVIDTFRATTTIAAALAAGAKAVRVFLTPADALAAAGREAGPKILAGERHCVRIEGFDLGNSPLEMTQEAVAGKTLLMTTTNGTRAILAARGAAEVLTMGLVNRAATCRYLQAAGRDITFLCAGTNGLPAPEDEAAAHAGKAWLDGDVTAASPAELLQRLAQTPGAQSIRAAGLHDDISFAARLDVMDLVCRIDEDGLIRRVRAAS